MSNAPFGSFADRNDPVSPNEDRVRDRAARDRPGTDAGTHDGEAHGSEC